MEMKNGLLRDVAPSYSSWPPSSFLPSFHPAEDRDSVPDSFSTLSPRQDRWHRLLPDACVSFYETFQLPLVKSLSLSLFLCSRIPFDVARRNLSWFLIFVEEQ